MELIELDGGQGSPQWHAHRLTHFNASEAAAMLGLCPYKTREQLLREKKTGLTPEISAYQQKIFEQGHRFEELARPFVEENIIVGKELFPCVGVLEGTKLSASFDGLTMDGALVWEHKTLSNKLRDALETKQIPLHYRAQLEQQLLVSGASEALFTASRFNEDGECEDIYHLTYESDPELRQRIIHGWQQFEQDLAQYEASALKVKALPTEIAPLSTLHIEAKGELIACNLDSVKAQVQAVLDSLPQTLETDDDFAGAEGYVKFSRQAEKALVAAAQQLINSMPDIAQTYNDLRLLSNCLHNNRLHYEKCIKAEKENRKNQLIHAALDRVHDHIRALNEGLPVEYRIKMLPRVTSELTAAIKGLKTLSSVQNALDSVVLKYQSEASEQSQRQHQQAKAAQLEAEIAPPLPLSEAELAQHMAVMTERGRIAWAGIGNASEWVDELRGNTVSEAELAHLSPLALLNRHLHPMQILDLTGIDGLREATSESWQAVKASLIAHIEQAIKEA